MDDRTILNNIYQILKAIKTAKSFFEYNDIENNLNKIDSVLMKKYINEIENGQIVTKDKRRVYEELLDKYKNKEDWKCSGFDAYHRLYYGFYQNPNSKHLSNKTIDDIDISLINLRGWIIRYWAYKFCKDKMHDQIEDFFIKDTDALDDVNELENLMNELDSRILQRCRAIIY